MTTNIKFSEDAVADARHLGNPGTSSFQVNRYPFYLLNRLVSRYNVVIEARLKTIGIDIPYWRVLMVLGQKSPRSVGELAATAVIPFSTMTRIVQRMTVDGLIVGNSPRSDNRVTEILLTAAGRSKLAKARKITAPIYERVIEGFSEEEFKTLTANLDQLYESLRDLVPPRS